MAKAEPPLDPNDEPSEEERALFAAWSRAYQGLPAPEVPDDLEQADARTQAAVGWMQAAWAELEVPAVRLPSQRRRSARWRPAQRTLVLLAAALLFLLGAWMLRLEFAPAEQEADDLARQGQPAEAPASGAQGASTAPSAAPEDGQAAKLEGVSVQAGQAPNNMEFRSGDLTLVLVTGA